MILRLLGNDAESLVFILEDAVQGAHDATMDGEHKEDAAALLDSALRLLRQLDEDSPIFDVEVKAGEPVDWDHVFADEATADIHEDSLKP